jgi:TRAP transporter TAXI family solute receptor
MRKRNFKGGIGIVLLMLLGLGFTGFMTVEKAVAAPEKVRLSMGGSNTGTWIYMFCAIMADVWKRYLPDVDITLMATGGTTANYLPMDKGEMDLAGAATFGDYWALNGMYFAKGKKLVNFCSLLPASKAFSHVFTYVDSPIKTLKDLDGKRVHLGARASPTSIVNEEIFKILGIKPNYVYSTPTEAVDMVKDRRVDAMAYSVGAPWSAIMDIATDRPIKFLHMKPEEQKKIADTIPYQVPDTIPAKTYSFQTEDYPTVMGLQNLIVRPGLSEELVYKLTKTAWEHWDEVVKATAAAKWVKAKDIVHMIAPVHPGAAKYYKEIGIEIPDRLIWKKK